MINVKKTFYTIRYKYYCCFHDLLENVYKIYELYVIKMQRGVKTKE